MSNTQMRTLIWSMYFTNKLPIIIELINSPKIDRKSRIFFCMSRMSENVFMNFIYSSNTLPLICYYSSIIYRCTDYEVIVFDERLEHVNGSRVPRRLVIHSVRMTVEPQLRGVSPPSFLVRVSLDLRSFAHILTSFR